MKKTKNKNIRRTVTFVLLAALVTGLAAMPLLTAGKVPEEEFPLSTLSEKAERREISLWLRAGGTLTEEDALSVTVASDVKLTEFLVENGDAVKAGDPIATVDRVTVMTAIASVQEAMETLEAQLEEERTGSTTDTITAPGGLVKKVYAQAGDRAEDVMLEHGALVVISLDGLMKLELPAETALLAGDRLPARIAGETVEATVKSNLDGILTVTFPDNGYEEGETVLLTTPEGVELGQGECQIHAPWKAVAYSGTVSYVSVREGRTLYQGGTVLGLKDIPYSAEYRSLAARHRSLGEQLLELFRLYQTLTLTAPCDGVVSGIDQDSAQLLKSESGWSVTLLKNAPGEDPDGEYLNFVGQVLQEGSDGYVMRLNPSFISITDYTDLSGVPLDTAAMTYETVYAGDAPVYCWNGGSWAEGSFAVGDILLFAGDSTGRIVWVIPVGSGEVPGETPDEPEDPTDPDDSTDPGEDGSEEAGGSGSGRPSGSGSASMPSSGSSAGQEQTQSYSLGEVQVAQVTPQDTMTLPVTVDELDLNKVRLGQTVEVTVDALSGRTFSGTVTAIGSTGTNSGGSSKFTVTVTLPREADMLSGMNAGIAILLGSGEGVAVPVAALSQQDGVLLVYTAKDPETGKPSAPREVTTGLSDGEYVLVEDLPEGTEIWYTYYEALE